MNAREEATKWLSYEIDDAYRTEIHELLDGPAAVLEDAFYKGLEFGTGGMRGIMGAGTNRVNRYTFGKATQGLANYLKQQFPKQLLKVAIAYDCRNNSDELSQLVADILSSNGIEVYRFEALRPTPELSFAVRSLNCHSGIVITASHNPPEYNGYKVYWNDGAQIVAPHDRGIIDEVDKIDNPAKIQFDARKDQIKSLGSEMDEAFMEASLNQRRSQDIKKDLSIVITSLHGTSITIMPKLLKRAGYENVHIVEEQATPDGNFPTVKSPNPEERAALDMALKLADEVNADCVIGTDPDSDRIGVAVRSRTGEMMLLNGNQTGVILTEYLLRHTDLDASDFIAYTIVSSDLFKDVADHHGIGSEICLTGFKHIAKLIRDFEGKRRFIGGGEESYGYMVGDFVRDKDALTSALIFCDWLGETIAAGQTTEDFLEELYERHGIYREHLLSITKKGKEGGAEIAKMMEDLRTNPPASLAGDKVIRLDDLNEGVATDLRSGGTTKLTLPQSNVLQFYTARGSKVSARPSGTEPKIKFYFSVRRDWDPSLSLLDQEKILDASIKEIIEDLNLV